jgi:hypothetical protein
MKKLKKKIDYHAKLLPSYEQVVHLVCTKMHSVLFI